MKDELRVPREPTTPRALKGAPPRRLALVEGSDDVSTLAPGSATSRVGSIDRWRLKEGSLTDIDERLKSMGRSLGKEEGTAFGEEIAERPCINKRHYRKTLANALALGSSACASVTEAVTDKSPCPRHGLRAPAEAQATAPIDAMFNCMGMPPLGKDDLEFDCLVEDRRGYRPPRGHRKALADARSFEAIQPTAESGRWADVDEKLESHEMRTRTKNSEMWTRTSSSPDVDEDIFEERRCYRPPRGHRKALADARAFEAIETPAESGYWAEDDETLKSREMWTRDIFEP